MELEAFGQALLAFGSGGVWAAVGIGVVIGLVLGIMPGLNALTGLALFLPFAFFLPATQAMPLMVAMSSVVFTGGAITAILLNVPGTEGNAATLIDGFPMTQRGEGGRAIGAALLSSTLGGLGMAFLALAMVPLVLLIIMGITSAEMTFIILTGIAFISVLGAGSMIRGIISGGLGLLISFIGFQAVTGVSRFDFGSLYLYDSLPLVPVALGLFALPEAIVLSAQGGAIDKRGVDIGGMTKIREGMKDVLRHWSLLLRSSIIGYIIGIIPGIGGMTAQFIAYAQAKQTSRQPEKFGTGCVEGVIAPQSADNATQAGALLTTLALGIPGNAVGALLLGGLLMVGLIPGPEMMTKHLDLSLMLILVVVVSNALAMIILLPIAPHVAKVASVPSRILAPIVISIIFVGVFAVRQEFSDLIVVLVFAALGFGMRRFGYSRPALFLGYILGTPFERFFFLGLRTSGPTFFARPINLVLIVIIIGVIVSGPLRSRFSHKRVVRTG